jgi:predicted enzyme related to lactoylglutathione lyase
MVQSVGTASHWLVYFRVSDVDATVMLARDLGASLVAGPIEVSGARYAALTDPYGATFAVSRPAR